jgi:uncharacterized protein (TIGR02246 family)
MIRLRLATLALGLCTLPTFAQEPNQLFTATHQQLDVTKVILAQERAWNKGDLDAYLAVFKDAPDTEAMLGGPIRGLANIRSAFHINFPNAQSMGTLEQSFVDVRPLGDDFAIATGRYHLSRPRKNGGDTDGTFIEVFAKTPQGWQVVFSQTS